MRLPLFFLLTNVISTLFFWFLSGDSFFVHFTFDGLRSHFSPAAFLVHLKMHRNSMLWPVRLVMLARPLASCNPTINCPAAEPVDKMDHRLEFCSSRFWYHRLRKLNGKVTLIRRFTWPACVPETPVCDFHG